MATVLNKRNGATEGVYVGRPTKWGNPYKVGNEKGQYARGEAAYLYKRYLWSNAALLAQLPELFGKDLVCWCKPNACHADHLLAAAAWAEANPEGLADRIAEIRRIEYESGY